MVEGFWILTFKAQQYTGGGVAVLIGGKIFGGDNGFSWVGTYSADDRMIKGRIRIHNFDPSVQSVFGTVGDYDMFLSGNVNGDEITGTALVAGRPQYSLGFVLTRTAVL